MILVRCIVAGVVALVVGGVSGYAISLFFVSAPLQRVLGPRYAEFDFFGAMGVTVFAAIMACAATIVVAARNPDKLRATFQSRNLRMLVLAPMAVILLLTFTLNREWAWLGLAHLATCFGILAGAGAALGIHRAANSRPNRCINRSGASNTAEKGAGKIGEEGSQDS